MNKHLVINSFYMPDGRKYENWEMVTFSNDSLKDYFLYEKYIIWYIEKQSLPKYKIWDYAMAWVLPIKIYQIEDCRWKTRLYWDLEVDFLYNWYDGLDLRKPTQEELNLYFR